MRIQILAERQTFPSGNSKAQIMTLNLVLVNPKGKYILNGERRTKEGPRERGLCSAWISSSSSMSHSRPFTPTRFTSSALLLSSLSNRGTIHHSSSTSVKTSHPHTNTPSLKNSKVYARKKTKTKNAVAKPSWPPVLAEMPLFHWLHKETLAVLQCRVRHCCATALKIPQGQQEGEVEHRMKGGVLYGWIESVRHVRGANATLGRMLQMNYLPICQWLKLCKRLNKKSPLQRFPAAETLDKS